MKVGRLIDELQHVKDVYGDVEVQLQDSPRSPGESVMSYESFFVVPEEYIEEEPYYVCAIRSWPY